MPVVVELFTSEGCSSCPPADELLNRLAATQPVAGVKILALAEHVDYWDHLGWRDPFSSGEFSRRQSTYDQRVFHQGSVYTPQMIVDGRQEVLGSDSAAALAAIKDALDRRESRLQVRVELERRPATLVASVRVAVPAQGKLLHDAEVLLALTQDGLESDVRGGENGGQRLRHSAVVRSLESLGILHAEEVRWSGDTTLSQPANAKPESLHIVALVQEKHSRKILGAASASLR